MSSVNLSQKHPQAYDAVIALDAAVATATQEAGLSPLLVELVKIRVSQINGCAFCLRMHTRDAIKLGETTDRLAVVAAWWESNYFTAEEQQALRLAEDVTTLPRTGSGEIESVLTDEQVSAVSWLAIVMNAWNRIAVRSHYPVAP